MSTESILTLVGVMVTCGGTLATIAFMNGKQASAVESLAKSMDELTRELKESNHAAQETTKEVFGIKTWREGVDARLKTHDELFEKVRGEIRDEIRDSGDSKSGMKSLKK